MIKISIKRLSVWVNSFLIGTVNIFQLIQLFAQHQFPVPLYLGVSGRAVSLCHISYFLHGIFFSSLEPEHSFKSSTSESQR